MLTLYGHEKSRAFRVLWLLEELELDYTFKRIDFGSGEHKCEWFTKIAPAGKVPVLDDNGFILTETSAILFHLYTNHNNASHLKKTTSKVQSLLLQWLFYGSCELEQGLWTAARHTFVLPEEKRIPLAVKWGQEEFSAQLPYLSNCLGKNSYILGEDFSIADITLVQILLWGLQQQKLDLKYENLKQYVEQNRTRPKYRVLISKLKQN